jgi:hypothetical protein
MDSHLIVGQIHDAFPKLPEKLARIKGVTPETIRSHHREPKSRNPMASGNASPVTHYIEYVYQNEAAERGSGRMLANRVHSSLIAEMDEDDGLSQADHFDAISDQNCDVAKWLGRFKIDTATPNQLVAFERECSEAIEALLAAKTSARKARRLKEAGLSVVTNGRARA